MLSYFGEVPTLCFSFSFATLFPTFNLERERGWKLGFSWVSLFSLLSCGILSWWGLCGLAVRSWDNKWLLLFYMESSLHFLEKQSPERRSCCLKPLRMNDRASQTNYFFTAVTFTSKSYLSMGWFCTQPWDVTYTTSITYSLYHDDSGLSYRPNGLKILGGRKMKIAVVYNIAQYVLMLLISERMDE